MNHEFDRGEENNNNYFSIILMSFLHFWTVSCTHKQTKEQQQFFGEISRVITFSAN
jgi:hypothetical protein